MERCDEHTGCEARIDNLEKDSTTQWAKIDGLCERIDKILTYMSGLLGGVAVACILLAVNLLVKK